MRPAIVHRELTKLSPFSTDDLLPSKSLAHEPLIWWRVEFSKARIISFIKQSSITPNNTKMNAPFRCTKTDTHVVCGAKLQQLRKKKERRSSQVAEDITLAKSALADTKSKRKKDTSFAVMKEMDPQSIIDMLEAYGGTDADRDRAVDCLQTLKNSKKTKPKRPSNKTRPAIRPKRPSVQDANPDWASVSITDLLVS